MTGFARVAGPLSERLAAELVVRSVNGKHLDVNVRSRGDQDLPEAEAAVRLVLNEHLSRGRVHVELRLRILDPGAAEVMLDSRALKKLMDQLKNLGANGGVSVGDLLGLPGMVSISREAFELDEVEIEALRELSRSVVARLNKRREGEGRRLVEHIHQEANAIFVLLDWVRPMQDKLRDSLMDKLRNRMTELLGDASVDETRLLQEAALAADRADVSEEIARLAAHLEHLEARLLDGGVIGRGLDFLCQEILRELSTMAAKLRDVGLASKIIDARTAVERIREQAQNIE